MIDAKILQIVPADGWFSAHAEEGTAFSYDRLVCWALVEHTDGTREIVGMEADGFNHDCPSMGVDHGQDCTCWRGYLHASELPKNKPVPDWDGPEVYKNPGDRP